MKKFLAVFMAALVIFTTMSIAAMAEESSTAIIEITEPSEGTTRDIMNDEGLVVPINTWQFRQSVVFKFFEKIFKFFLYIFGVQGKESDNSAARLIDEIGSALDERLSRFFG